MKILFVATDFSYVGSKGVVMQGGGIASTQLIEALIKRGIDISVVTRAEKDIVRELYDIPIYRTRYLYLGFRESKITHSLFAAYKALEVSKGCDIIHSHNPPAALAGFLASKLRGIPHLLTMHGPWAGVRQRWITRKMARLIEWFAVHMVDHITCVSQSLKKEMNEVYGVKEEKLTYIQNAVNTDMFKRGDKEEAREKLGLDLAPEDKLILYTGRFVEEKGLPYLLEGSTSVFDKHENVRILLIGGGFDEEIVRRWLKENSKYRDRIFTVGFFGYEKMVNAYNSSDIFVLPSMAEGMSCSLLEAMACELPVIATRVGGNTELIDKERGILVEPRNPGEIREAIEKILNDEDMAKRMGRNAREFVKKNMNVGGRVNKFIKLYERISKQ